MWGGLAPPFRVPCLLALPVHAHIFIDPPPLLQHPLTGRRRLTACSKFRFSMARPTAWVGTAQTPNRCMP